MRLSELVQDWASCTLPWPKSESSNCDVETSTTKIFGNHFSHSTSLVRCTFSFTLKRNLLFNYFPSRCLHLSSTFMIYTFVHILLIIPLLLTLIWNVFNEEENKMNVKKMKDMKYRRGTCKINIIYNNLFFDFIVKKEIIIF